jgi:hypothetical protein
MAQELTHELTRVIRGLLSKPLKDPLPRRMQGAGSLQPKHVHVSRWENGFDRKSLRMDCPGRPRCLRLENRLWSQLKTIH